MLAQTCTVRQVTSLTGVDHLPVMGKRTARDENAGLISHRDSLSWSKIANALLSGKTHSCVALQLELPGLRLKFQVQNILLQLCLMNL